MEKNDIKIQLEELNIEESMIEEILSKINNKEGISMTADQVKQLQEIDLKNKISNEEDWEKKASLAARIVSLNLE